MAVLIAWAFTPNHCALLAKATRVLINQVAGK
jgi:hypothetical protein